MFNALVLGRIRSLLPMVQRLILSGLNVRTYVGTEQEISEYFESRKRALEWLQCFSPKYSRYRRMDSAAIERALKFHLFDPVSRLKPGQKHLTREVSMEAFDITQGLLADLTPYFSTRNIITFVERLGRILAYSQSEVWTLKHQDCVLDLVHFVKLAVSRCTKNDLTMIVWSFGKFGTRLLSLELKDEEGDYVRNLLMRIIQRIQETGVKGELDCIAINNLMNGLCNLGFYPEESLRRLILRQLKLHVEFADSYNLTRLVWSLQRLGIDTNNELLSMICSTAEMKAKAFNFASKDFIYFAQMLSSWKHTNPACFNFAQFLLQVLQRGSDLSTEDVILGLEATVRFGLFPDASLLDQVASRFQDKMSALPPKIWISFLKSFAELGIRPVKVLEQMKGLIMDQEQNIHTADLFTIFQSLCIMNSMEMTLLENCLLELKSALMRFTELEKATVYQVILHLKHHFTETNENSSLNLDPEFIAIIRQSWQIQERTHHEKSKSQIHTLQGKVPSYIQLETIEIDKGDFVFSALASDDGTKRAVVFGKNTFLNKEKRLFGSVLWRKRILRSLGWQSIDVDSSTTNDELIASFRTR